MNGASQAQNRFNASAGRGGRVVLCVSCTPGNGELNAAVVSRWHVTMDSPTGLCIDDGPQVLDLRKATLESHGYRVKIASRGYTAMKILGEGPQSRCYWSTKRKSWTGKR